MHHLPAWEDPRKVLARRGLAPKRGFSQNFLISRQVVDAIAVAAVARPDQVVVELGAGLGTLTAALVRAGARVFAIERDREMVATLSEEFALYPSVQVMAADATLVDLGAFAELAGGLPVVAGNIPYAVTGEILRHLVACKAHFEQAVLMVQREVSDRLRAQPGSKAYGALTLFTTAAFQIESVMRVSASAFYPRPKVDSTVVRLLPHASPRAHESPAFRFLVHSAFQQRRKTLRNALRSAASGATSACIDQVLGQAAIDGGRRGECLSVEEFARLAAFWDSAGLPLSR